MLESDAEKVRAKAAGALWILENREQQQQQQQQHRQESLRTGLYILLPSVLRLIHNVMRKKHDRMLRSQLHYAC